jgi:hypothetical protein
VENLYVAKTEITANIHSAQSQAANVNVANATWKHHTIPISPPVLSVSHAMPVNQLPQKKKKKIIIIYVVYGAME